jgi:hypothetical protein
MPSDRNEKQIIGNSMVENLEQEIIVSHLEEQGAI